jgi:hypothetical protein
VKQFAYQTGKSMEIAFHDVPTSIEIAVKHKEMTAGAFLMVKT